jgi:hypothetical protein
VPREVNIDVKVFVNPSGKVDYWEVLSKVTAVVTREARRDDVLARVAAAVLARD